MRQYIRPWPSRPARARSPTSTRPITSRCRARPSARRRRRRPAARMTKTTQRAAADAASAQAPRPRSIVSGSHAGDARARGSGLPDAQSAGETSRRVAPGSGTSWSSDRRRRPAPARPVVQQRRAVGSVHGHGRSGGDEHASTAGGNDERRGVDAARTANVVQPTSSSAARARPRHVRARLRRRAWLLPVVALVLVAVVAGVVVLVAVEVNAVEDDGDRCADGRTAGSRARARRGRAASSPSR